MKLLTLTSLTTLLTLTTSAPIADPEPAFPTGGNIITPTTISQYSVNTGAITFATPRGRVFKPGDITTLITFTIPSAAAGRTCSLHFTLTSSSDTVTGSGQIDFFESNAPAPGNRASWPPGNQRNNYGGRLSVKVGGEAAFVDGIQKKLQSWPCPAAGAYGIEAVGVNDRDDIGWDGSGSGPYITY